MHIPTYLIPIRANRTQSKPRPAVKFDKAEPNTQTPEKSVIVPVMVQDKREGEDRRKRNIKPLLDTRTGKDRRFERRRQSVDIKA